MKFTDSMGNTSGLEDEFWDAFRTFSGGISLDWLNINGGRIIETPAYDTLLHLFPPLKGVFQNGLDRDSEEFFRTLIHTFQAQAVFNEICSGDFPESGLDREVIRKVYQLARSISSFSPLMMPLILWLHDIGRLEDKERHHEKSAEIISRLAIIKGKGLSKEEDVLIRKVVQYHLLMGTLYTGESSYASFEPLLMDEEFETLMGDRALINLFLDSLTLFTMIDVWGYHIHGISPLMIDSYLGIGGEMKEVFLGTDVNEITEGLRARSQKHMDWRLMGYLMAFSKIGKKPHLTMDFYASLIEDGYRRYAEREGVSLDWDRFKARYLEKIHKVQYKYGLGVLIPLAYGGAGKKMRLTDQTRVNPNLFHLLVTINNRIREEEVKNAHCIPDALWNVIFRGYPPWNRKTDFHEKLNESGRIEEIVREGMVEVNRGEGVNTLLIDYQGFWQYLED